ncbi:MAG: hypothetical protein U0326_06070 [Polyangiales bacterium]
MSRTPRAIALVFALGLGCVFTSRPQLPASEQPGDASNSMTPTSYDAAAPSDVPTGVVDDTRDGAARSDATRSACGSDDDAGDADDLRDAGDAGDASDAGDAGDAGDASDAGDAGRHAGCDAGVEVGPGAAGR